MIMARSNDDMKLDCEYTLEEAKNVDANDITTHPFFKKHFATSDSRPGPFSSTLYVKPDKEQDHVIHYITHTPLDPHHESNIDHSKHAVKIETQHYGRTKHIGHGRGMTVHEAMDNAVHTYTHPLKIKPLTESLVGKKPATASKLFAEAMEARLDEISKKVLGSYAKKAVADRDELHYERDFSKRRAKEFLDNGNKEKAAEFSAEAAGISKKRAKRAIGINKAVDRLTKEDLDESRLDETEDHDYAEGKYAHLVGKTVHSDRGPVKVAHVLDPFAFAPYQATDDEGRTYNIHKGGTLHRAPKFQRGYKDIKEDEGLDEVEAPANFWNAGMSQMNPIQVSQKQPAEPGQFKATLAKSPKRLADQDSSLEGKPRAVRDETEATAASRGPKTIELTGDWHADVPDHQFDPKLDSETEYYPLFSQFKSLGAYPSGPARAWESEEIDESEKFDTSYMDHPVFKRNFNSTNKAYDHNDAEHHYVATNFGTDHHVRIKPRLGTSGGYTAEVYSQAHGQRRHGWAQGATSYEALDKAHKAYKENYKMPEYMREDELNEISKKLTGKYVEFAIRDRDKHIEDATKARASADALQNVRTGTNYVADDKKRDLRDLIGDMERKAHNKKYKRERGIIHALSRLTKEDLDEDELNEISKKTLASYATKAVDELGISANVAGGATGANHYQKHLEMLHAKKRARGIKKAVKKLSEDSSSLMATATKDEKKAAEQDKKKPSEFKKLHDKHEAEVKSKMKELGEEALQEGLFDPAKQPLLALWDEHARRSDAHGSGSRTEILKRIEDHVAKKHGQEGLKKMRLHSDLSNALKNSVSGDKGHLQALLGNMRAKCAMEQ